MELNEYIKQLCNAADSPKQTLIKSMNANGKKAIGWVEPYAPLEIIYACNCIPVALWGGEIELCKARTYLPPFACSIMQSIMEYENNGTYDMLSAVLIPSNCDTLKCFGQKWKAKCPCIQFVHPQNRELEAAVDFLASEYKTICKKLEKAIGLKITDEAISNAIILYNEWRSAMREFTEIAPHHPDLVTPAVRHKIIKASYFMDIAEYMPIITRINELLQLRKPAEWNGKRVVITGLTMEPTELLDILEQFEINVSSDDLAQESRQFRTLIPFAGTPLRSLAKQWQNHFACSLAYDPHKKRIQHVLNQVKATDANGVIIALMKFCDPEEYDVPILVAACKKNHIPVLVIEIDQQATSYEQIRTRIQSFVESM